MATLATLWEPKEEFVNMADEAARRRELRRRRILENAEERKRKILGATSAANTTTVKDEAEKPQEPGVSLPNSVLANDSQSRGEPSGSNSCNTSKSPINTELHNAAASDNRTASRDYTDINQPRLSNTSRIQNGSVPDISEQLLNFNRLITANGSITPNSLHSGRTQEDVQPIVAPGTLDTFMVPVILALIVCFLLSVNLGYVVSNSISIPFLLWEVQHLWCQRYAIQASSRSGAGLMGIALMLCGVRQTTVTTYAQLITIVKRFLEDFAVYILTVVLWCTLIGLPGVVRLDTPLEPTQPVLPREDVPGDTDVFNPLEDF
ncbi:uncharacterized protein mRpL28 isoform X2 [Panulirus ornatus]|uniref:uncharacterized protein mRpL28 isoform X2 n=1 Tax=Panulirus ornatus TaxID=150431 RepID=UPI003A84BE2A